MFKKLLSMILALSMIASLGLTSAMADENVTISYYSTQAGVDDQTIALLDAFMAQNPGITVNYYPCGDDQLAAWLALYNAGTAPTVSLLDVGQILNYSDYLMDLTTLEDKEWMSHVTTGWNWLQKEGSDAIYGIPGSFQGFALIYNKRIVSEVFGADFDVKTVNTVSKLAEFFKAIDDAGVNPTVVFSADWALAAHYMGCQFFSEWMGDKAFQREVLAALKEGDYSLMENETFNNIMDVFDLMLSYNSNAADPLADTQEGDLEQVATGVTATMFQGDWNWLQIQTFENRDDIALMPLPLTDDENDERNGKILASCPKGYAIDTYQNTPEQQAAGVKLAQFLALSPEGESFMVDLVGSTLPFDNVTAVNQNPLAVSTQEYLNEGKVLDISTYICEGPSDFWYVVGPFMQAYMAGQLDRAGLAAEIEDYFSDLD